LRKAEIIETIEQDNEEDAKEFSDVMFDLVLQSLPIFHISEQEVNEFLSSDNENILKYI